MACPLCGERCTCSFPDAPAAPVQSTGSHVAVLIDPERSLDSEQQFLASLEAPPEVTNLPEPAPGFYRPDPMWREEVASRVDAYRTRRGRPRRPDPSSLLSFDFDASPNGDRSAAPIAVGTDATWRPSAQVVEIPPPVLPESRIIEFPRPVVEPEPEPQMFIEELAEPVVETPRILEAPPEDVSVPEFGGVSLAPITLEEHSLEIETEPVPLRVAARGLRIFSGLVDVLLVLAAAAVFAMVVAQMVGPVPRSRATLALAAALPAFLWALYHYLFLAYAAATPGMSLANLRLSTFDGHSVCAEQRRWRALAMVISCISVGFGFVWALLDPDGLCWHDKITRTYLTQRTY